MSDRAGTRRDDELVRRFVRRDRTPATLTGTTTSGGANTERKPPFDNPMDAVGEQLRGGTGCSPVAVDAPSAAGQVFVSAAVSGGFAGAWQAGTGGSFEELAEDIVAGLLVAGSGIALTYNDGAGTLTVAASGGGGSGADYVYWPDGTDPEWATDADGHVLRA